MELSIGWEEIAWRLLCTVAAGVLIGLNREEHGRAAGLRTTLLVCLAASISMLLVNLLMNTKGKTSDSFVTMDVMRLPLGILSGMGFIGAGAIIRRDNIVLGVTTAATLWFVTVMGLCFGAGQILLGTTALVLGLAVLTGLKWTERVCKQDRSAELTLNAGTRNLDEHEIARAFAEEGYKLRFLGTSYGENGLLREVTCEIRWRGRPEDPALPIFIKQLAQRWSVAKWDWRVVAGH
jgi:putative Mg2+ transporter-C (MgtC) family protein